MKLGFITSLLDTWTYEEMMDAASSIGYSCVEVACWPNAKATRRYAGVCHIDVWKVLEDDAYAAHILDYSKKSGVEISSLAYYPNVLDASAEASAAAIDHLKAVMRASAKLGINMVTTFIGRDQDKTVEENLKLVAQVWPGLLELAESLGIRVGIENCPMLFGPDQWPGGQNLMTTPENWRKVFEILDSPVLGLNYDPSHFMWQMMDYVNPIYEFKDKIFHIHVKDIKMHPQKLAQVGIMAYPLDYMTPKIPGHGDIDWGVYCGALKDIGYDGPVCVEVEDRAFEVSEEKRLDALRLSKRYMDNFVI